MVQRNSPHTPYAIGPICNALERLLVPAFMIDRDRTIRWLNIAARDLVGKKEGSPFTDVVSTESLPWCGTSSRER